jgi:molecular chaperone GrpE
METTTDSTAMKQGIEIIYNKLSDFLKQNGVKEIESLNCSFDVDLHDAVAKIQVNEEDKKGKIVEVLSKGYFLKDKVLRHSQVVIGE